MATAAKQQQPQKTSKTLGPSQFLEFMCDVLESNCMEARLPEDKLASVR